MQAASRWKHRSLVLDVQLLLATQEVPLDNSTCRRKPMAGRMWRMAAGLNRALVNNSDHLRTFNFCLSHRGTGASLAHVHTAASMSHASQILVTLAWLILLISSKESLPVSKIMYKTSF